MRDKTSSTRFTNVSRAMTWAAPLLFMAACQGTGTTETTSAESSAAPILGGHQDFGGGHDDDDLFDDIGRARGAVLTSRNDNSRTGANLSEGTLTPSNVNVSSFGLVYTRNLDGKVYAQPLFVPHVKVSFLHHRDIVYVVTEHNTVYAFDANDAANPNPVWSRNLGPSVPSVDVNVPGRSCLDITPEIGISQTPTIDLDKQTMYVVAKVEENGIQNHRIFALDIRTGADKHAPTDLAASVPGTASDSVGGVLTFNPVRHNVRAGLLLHDDVLYVAATSHCDFPPWHGWVFAYDARTLRQLAVWVTTPDGAGGGVWQSGAGLSADDSGNVYAVAGNGTYEDGTVKPQIEFGQTIAKLKLKGNKLDLLDWFIPFNVDLQNFEDADLASPAMLIPDSNALVALTRAGRVPLKQMAEAYVLPRDNFGHFHAAQADEIAQTVLLSDPDNTADPTNNLLQRAYTMVHFKGPSGARIYCWAQNDFPRAYAFDGTHMNPTPVATGTDRAVSTTVTGMTSLSADRDRNGILWGSINVDNTDKNIAKTMLFAFDAETLQTLWNSRQNQARDEVGTWGKWAYPTVAGGKVFLGNADSQLRVYGLLP
jgi:outer membrane protein assembly factor BamB